MAVSAHDLIADGYIDHRDAIVVVGIAGVGIRQANVSDFTVTCKFNKQSVLCLGYGNEKYLPTYTQYEGSMSVIPDHGSWLAIVQFFDQKHYLPNLNVRVVIPRTSGTPLAPLLGDKAAQTTNALVDLQLNEVIFDEIVMVTAAPTDYTKPVDLAFSANEVNIRNTMPGNDILLTKTKITNLYTPQQ